MSVLIAGAGPTGLTLAIELARRGVYTRIVDRAAEFSVGSRGDGLQPRTLEVFEDLGVLGEILDSGMGAPLTRVYAGDEIAWEGRMTEPVEPKPDIPYPNLWFVPQWRTEEILRKRLADLGVQVELGTELTRFTQDGTGVTATLSRDGGSETVRASYLVGCDGGRSVVRKALGIPFTGTTDEDLRVLLADVRADGLDHELGHTWMVDEQTFFGLTPLATGPDAYVVAAPAGPDTDPSLDHLQRTLEAMSGRTDIRLRDLTWITVWRLNVRMAERFREGRVFLAGDAAHVHPPTGGQGLNTGVQDAYNLGWKLASVLAGAPAELLDSYEAERVPIAAEVLGVSSELLDKAVEGAAEAMRRDERTQQLGIGYASGPLAVDDREVVAGVRAGDRAPDAPCQDAGDPVRLFDLFRGPHWTLLRLGPDAPSTANPGITSYDVDAPSPGITDAEGHARRAYDVPDGTAVLVRPDGYIGLITSAPATLASYAEGFLP